MRRILTMYCYNRAKDKVILKERKLQIIQFQLLIAKFLKKYDDFIQYIMININFIITLNSSEVQRLELRGAVKFIKEMS